MTAQPTPEFAVLFRDFMVERIRDEHACTNRVFAELHDGDWRPDPKSRSARELAWHLAASERWFLASAGKRNFEGGGDPRYRPLWRRSLPTTTPDSSLTSTASRPSPANSSWNPPTFSARRCRSMSCSTSPTFTPSTTAASLRPTCVPSAERCRTSMEAAPTRPGNPSIRKVFSRGMTMVRDHSLLRPFRQRGSFGLLQLRKRLS